MLPSPGRSRIRPCRGPLPCLPSPHQHNRQQHAGTFSARPENLFSPVIPTGPSSLPWLTGYFGTCPGGSPAGSGGCAGLDMAGGAPSVSRRSFAAYCIRNIRRAAGMLRPVISEKIRLRKNGLSPNSSGQQLKIRRIGHVAFQQVQHAFADFPVLSEVAAAKELGTDLWAKQKRGQNLLCFSLKPQRNGLFGNRRRKHLVAEQQEVGGQCGERKQSGGARLVFQEIHNFRPQPIRHCPGIRSQKGFSVNVSSSLLCK